MGARAAIRIESAIDAGAAALFAAALGYVLWTITARAGTAFGAVPAFGLCFAGLRRVQPVRPASGMRSATARLTTPVTDLLAEADRSLAHAQDELVLDDILVALDPDSRVVRLFEREAMPTPGQLKADVDRHLNDASPASDDSQALHNALAELRRSLS